MVKKNLILFSGLVLVLSVLIVIAATSVTMNSPQANYNYSSTMNISCTITSVNHSATNVTFWYNASGGVAGTVLTSISNTSASQTVFESATYDISGLSDVSTYNFTCSSYNGTTVFATAVSNVTVDNTGANSTFVVPATNSNNSGNINVNVSVSDTLGTINSVYFNITNSTGTQKAFLQASNPGSSYYNYTVITNTTGYPDGDYNITIYANDTLGNLNDSIKRQITIDNTAPSVSLSKSSSDKDSITISISITEATSGVSGTCSVDGTGATSSGTGTSQTLTASSLTCGYDYIYTATCTDKAGNSGSGSVTASTAGCGGGGTTGGTTSDWTGTYIVDDEKAEKGFSERRKEKERIRISVNNQNHHIGVVKIENNKVTINVSSETQQATLQVGDEEKFEVDDDDYYDIYVKLNSIEENEANLTIQKIHELIPEEELGEGTEQDTGDQEEGQEEGTSEESYWWIWVLVILAVIVVVGYLYQKRK